MNSHDHGSFFGMSLFLVLTLGVLVITLEFPFHQVTPSSSVSQAQPQPQQQTAMLITNQTSGLKTYENPLYRFAFDFPLDWQIDMPTGAVQDEIIGVLSAESASMPAGTFGARTGLKVNVNNVSTYLDPESLQVKALTARDYANSWLDILSSSSGRSLFTYDIVNTAPTVLANESNAWRQEYITNIESKGQSIFTSEIYVVKDGLIYELSFYTNPLSVPETLPIGKKIMESFRFI